MMSLLDVLRIVVLVTQTLYIGLLIWFWREANRMLRAAHRLHDQTEVKLIEIDRALMIARRQGIDLEECLDG